MTATESSGKNSKTCASSHGGGVLRIAQKVQGRGADVIGLHSLDFIFFVWCCNAILVTIDQ